MEGVLALTIVCVIFGIGDYVSAKTKAIFSMMFVSSAILLVCFWVGLPATIFEDAALLKIGGIAVAFLITHMGTLMGFKELKKQWKTVIIAIGAVAGVGVFLFLVGSPILGKEYAVAAAPPISGGIVAAIIVSGAAKAKGLETIVVFTTLLLVMQGFFGYPVASIMLKKEARRILKLYRDKKSVNELSAEDELASSVETEETKKHIIPPLPKELQTSFILLAKLGIAAVVAFQLAALLNNVINKYVVCLIVGIIAREIGFLEENIMTKANAFGLAMVALLAIVFANLTKATPEIIISLIGPLVISLILGVIGIIIASFILGKILGYTKEMSISIGVSALFGFPATYVISKEISNVVGETDEEKQIILNEILPKMLVAGFITVTISSVILAGVMAKML